jgi:FlaG/FlaF family flagellin (archaellin)
MPAIETIADAPKAIGAITAAVARGQITVTDAADVSRLVETYVRAIEASDLDKRLRALEEATRCERER